MPRLDNFIENIHSLLNGNDHQYGFRANSSNSEAVMEISTAVDNQE